MSAPAWAVKGAKVVCVRDFSKSTRHYDLGHRSKPEVDQVYEITDTMDVPLHHTAVIFLRGFPGDQGFDVRGFRPLVSNDRTEEQDVALFAHHLNKIPAKQDA